MTATGSASLPTCCCFSKTDFGLTSDNCFGKGSLWVGDEVHVESVVGGRSYSTKSLWDHVLRDDDSTVHTVSAKPIPDESNFDVTLIHQHCAHCISHGRVEGIEDLVASYKRLGQKSVLTLHLEAEGRQLFLLLGDPKLTPEGVSFRPWQEHEAAYSFSFEVLVSSRFYRAEQPTNKQQEKVETISSISEMSGAAISLSSCIGDTIRLMPDSYTQGRSGFTAPTASMTPNKSKRPADGPVQMGQRPTKVRSNAVGNREEQDPAQSPTTKSHHTQEAASTPSEGLQGGQQVPLPTGADSRSPSSGTSTKAQAPIMTFDHTPITINTAGGDKDRHARYFELPVRYEASFEGKPSKILEKVTLNMHDFKTSKEFFVAIKYSLQKQIPAIRYLSVAGPEPDEVTLVNEKQSDACEEICRLLDILRQTQPNVKPRVNIAHEGSAEH